MRGARVAVALGWLSVTPLAITLHGTRTHTHPSWQSIHEFFTLFYLWWERCCGQLHDCWQACVLEPEATFLTDSPRLVFILLFSPPRLCTATFFVFRLWYFYAPITSYFLCCINLMLADNSLRISLVCLKFTMWFLVPLVHL